MITEKSINESLSDVLLPGLQRDISSMGLIQAVELAGNKVKVTLASSALDDKSAELGQREIHERNKGIG